LSGTGADAELRTYAMARHDEVVVDQFTRQAVPYSQAPAIRDEEALHRLVEFSGATPDDTLLDVACGPGVVVCAFAAVARHATGIDLTPAMIERARALQRQKGLSNVSWIVGDARRLPWPDRSFSIVTSRFALHHCLEPIAVLREMKRVCRPEGKVAVVDVIASPDPTKAAAFERMEKLRDPSHVRALSLAELEALIRGVGLPPPRKAFDQAVNELEAYLARSFPDPADADEIRRMFVASLDDDAMGLATRRVGDQIWFHHDVALLVSECVDAKHGGRSTVC